MVLIVNLDFVFIKSIFLFIYYDLRSHEYSGGLHTFNTHKAILQITMYIYIYINRLETSSAINPTGCWIANEHDDTAQMKNNINV